MNLDFDFLLIGHGIAGNTLAWHLHNKGYKIAIVDSSSFHSSTRVAAGIFNPLTGRKLVKTWLADDIFPYAKTFYTSIEEKLQTQVLHNVDLYRPFRNEQEKKEYLKLAETTETSTYIAKNQLDKSDNQYIKAPFNGLTVTQTGWVDLPILLDKSVEFFQKEQVFLDEQFSVEDVHFQENHIQWKDYTSKYLILCQGLEAVNNDLFNWLPFNPVKGQLMDVTIDGYAEKEIINQGLFMIPLGNEQVRIGATYSWHELDWKTTLDSREYLTQKLNPILQKPFTIVNEKAGIRPSTKDRRPIIGFHPEIKQLGIFNGLGTKGVTLAPYFANQFVNHIENSGELDAEAHINRHFSLYHNRLNS